MRDLPVAGCVLHRLCLDGELYLGMRRTSPELWTELRIGSRLTLRRGGASEVLSAEQPDTLAPLLALVGGVVDSVEVTENGELTATLRDGSQISVVPLDAYEAWQYSDSEQRHVVCLPGGGTATW